MAELKYRNAAAGAAGIDFVATGRQTRKLLTAAGIAKSLGGRPLFAGLDLMLTPGTKLGLLGPNGSGKSTLLRVLAGETRPRRRHGHAGRRPARGDVRAGPGGARSGGDAAAGPLPQRRHGGVSATGRCTSWPGRSSSSSGRSNWTCRSADLSGGEQARVRIAQLMLQPADLLLLDEPTNDLDIPALEVLEDSLAEFPGALVLVSHDRDLMDRLCTEVVGLDGRGGAALYGSVANG